MPSPARTASPRSRGWSCGTAPSSAAPSAPRRRSSSTAIRNRTSVVGTVPGNDSGRPTSPRSRPDVVVVQAGAWDIYDVVGPGDSVLHPGDPAWNASYRQDVTALFDTLSASGASVVAIRPPCYGTTEVVGGGTTPPERLDPTRLAAVDTAWQHAARARDNVQLLDLEQHLVPRRPLRRIVASRRRALRRHRRRPRRGDRGPSGPRRGCRTRAADGKRLAPPAPCDAGSGPHSRCAWSRAHAQRQAGTRPREPGCRRPPRHRRHLHRHHRHRRRPSPTSPRSPVLRTLPTRRSSGSCTLPRTARTSYSASSATRNRDRIPRSCSSTRRVVSIPIT